MSEVPDSPGAIVPPPLVYASLFLSTLALDRVVGRPRTALPPPLRAAAGVATFGCAALLFSKAVRSLRRADTAIAPWHAASTLVRTGVYARTRNPMYLAMTLSYIGAALTANRATALSAVIPLVVVIDGGYIAREERHLAATFGAAYDEYRARVPRWVPLRTRRRLAHSDAEPIHERPYGEGRNEE